MSRHVGIGVVIGPGGFSTFMQHISLCMTLYDINHYVFLRTLAAALQSCSQRGGVLVGVLHYVLDPDKFK